MTLAAGYDADRAGDIGQDEFGILAKKAGLSVAAPYPDRVGIDFVLALPRPLVDGIVSLDRRRLPPRINVQIKTIFSDRRSVPVTLDVLEPLAKDLSPAVVCIVRMTPDMLKVVDLHLVHLVDGNLGRVLRRLREAAREG